GRVRAVRDRPALGPGGAAVPPVIRSAPARALAAYADQLWAEAESERYEIARRWGLEEPPLRPPAPPIVKPRPATEEGLSVGDGLPPVITRVPTHDRVVFLTIDDGAEKDPELTRMMRELRVPFSAFLTDYLAREDYGYFREQHRLGLAGMHNHTLNHHDLRKLPYEDQRHEICEQQRNLRLEFGESTTLFRPPYGSYDADTLRAARSCGVRVVPLWAQEAFPDRIEFRKSPPELRPGDIILTHFRGRGQWGGSMTDMVRRVLRTATEQGFAVARLEDYL
ncbi:polysaccharide deacetylase family protein, partial [Streptomyces sp. URMC 123]|uniref:polysaccharide deacetylase family protein n=1 Tax=Streptomyces sp. URMC 123 TaxID=3423403 RepID=UPI003F19CD31